MIIYCCLTNHNIIIYILLIIKYNYIWIYDLYYYECFELASSRQVLVFENTLMGEKRENFARQNAKNIDVCVKKLCILKL